VSEAAPGALAGVHTDHHAPQGFWRTYVFSQDHKTIGIQYAITALLFLLNFGVGTLLLRSLWLGVGEILAGGVLALILVRRIQKDDSSRENEEVAPPSRVEECDVVNRG